MKVITRLLTRYWGYLALAVAVAGYFLLQAPVWCGAEIRTGEPCRKNSHGLLRGCSIRQHKWQRVRQTFTPAGGRALLTAGKSAGGFLALLGGVVAGVQVVIAGAGIALH